MTTEKHFTVEHDDSSKFYFVHGNNDLYVELYSRNELEYLGVPQEVFEAIQKGPVKFKLTFEALCE